MDIITDLSRMADDAQGCVLAIGNFDGVHKGHQAVLRRIKEMAGQQGVPGAVLTFEPHPRKLFRPDDPPFRITPAPLKHRRLAQGGVDTVFSLPFDWDFASQSAEEFIDRVLVNGIRPRKIVVGKDFRFGQLRRGTPDMIADAGIEVELTDDLGGPDGKYSSTAIRQFLRAGDIASANGMLGWDWEIEGEIVRGDRRGHDLGYPTANVPLDDALHPAYGIYATLVQIEGEAEWRPAATNIGIRPMFELKAGQVEAHILDFEDRDIYGRVLRIRPVRRLRGEAKFSDLDALIAQMEEDCRQTRLLLRRE